MGLFTATARAGVLETEKAMAQVILRATVRIGAAVGAWETEKAMARSTARAGATATVRGGEIAPPMGAKRAKGMVRVAQRITIF